MDEQQARDLAARIRAQFPHVSTLVLESADTRNAPHHWLIGVQRSGELEGVSIHIHNENEWIEAVTAWFVLNKPAILDERNPFTPPEIELYPDPATGLWRVAAKQEPPSLE